MKRMRHSLHEVQPTGQRRRALATTRETRFIRKLLSAIAITTGTVKSPPIRIRTLLATWRFCDPLSPRHLALVEHSRRLLAQFPAAQLPTRSHTLPARQRPVDQSAYALFFLRLRDENHPHRALPSIPRRRGLVRPAARPRMLPTPAQFLRHRPTRCSRISASFQQKLRTLNERPFHASVWPTQLRK
jgi:hypothetical protein